MAAGLATLLAAAACYHPSPNPGAPCSDTGECPSGQSCDMSQSPPICVEALIDAALPVDGPLACIGLPDCTNPSAPVCDPTSHTCRGCIADAECGGVCIESSGECVGNGQAIFVSPQGTDAGNCTANAPCRTFNFAFQQLTPNRRTIRVGDGIYMSSGSSIVNLSDTGGRIVISGEDRDPAGATFTAVTNGLTNPVVIQLGNNTDVVVEGITIQDGTNDGIRGGGALLVSRVAIRNNTQRGIEHLASNGAALKVWDSVIEGNHNDGVYVRDGVIEMLRSFVGGNDRGGMLVEKTQSATIIGSMFVNNGDAQAPYGGLRFTNTNGLPVVVSFVTAAFNECSGGGATAAGIATADVIAIENSIVSDNINTAVPPTQLCDTCTATYSLFSGTIPAGMGNIAGPAQFVDPTNNDFHLMATSPARDAANPAAATAGTDIDGDARPQGTASDIGADEIVP